MKPTRANQVVQMDVQVERRMVAGRAVSMPLLVLTDLFDGRRVVVELDRGRIERLRAGLARVYPTAPPRPLGDLIS